MLYSAFCTNYWNRNLLNAKQRKRHSRGTNTFNQTTRCHVSSERDGCRGVAVYRSETRDVATSQCRGLRYLHDVKTLSLAVARRKPPAALRPRQSARLGHGVSLSRAQCSSHTDRLTRHSLRNFKLTRSRLSTGPARAHRPDRSSVWHRSRASSLWNSDSPATQLCRHGCHQRDSGRRVPHLRMWSARRYEGKSRENHVIEQRRHSGRHAPVPY